MIVPQELKNYRLISSGYKLEKIQDCISLAETDMRELIGDNLYFDVMGNLTNVVYEPLLEGSNFERNEVNFTHGGLKQIFADFTYARYIQQLNTNHTPHGIVVKDSQDSTTVDKAMIKDMVKQAQIDADKRWELVKYFLDANKETFPIWNKNKNTNANDVRPGNTRFNFLSTGRNSKF